jgi:integrase
MRIGKLTTSKLAKVRTEIGRHGDGAGLFLQVTSRTAASWLFRYQRGDRERWLGLGSADTINAVEARERARRARQQILDGVDPIDAKRATRAAAALEAAKGLTFEDATKQFYAQHSPKWKNDKHKKQFLSSLMTFAFPIIGKLSVASIDTQLVLRVLERDRFWYEKTQTADRVRNRIESVLAFAKTRGARRGDNPATWRSHLENILPGKAQIAQSVGHKAMDYSGVPEFFVELVKRQGLPARALSFLILTAARTGEVRFAVWSEVDLDSAVWTIPANRMKAGKEHRVPLSDQALAILWALPREGDYLFPGARKGRPINVIAMADILKRMGRSETVHGMRAAFSTWANDRVPAYPQPIIEMSLAHAVGNAVSRAYARGDLLAQRARLMADWGRFCTEPQRDATVIRLNR